MSYSGYEVRNGLIGLESSVTVSLSPDEMEDLKKSINLVVAGNEKGASKDIEILNKVSSAHRQADQLYNCKVKCWYNPTTGKLIKIEQI